MFIICQNILFLQQNSLKLGDLDVVGASIISSHIQNVPLHTDAKHLNAYLQTAVIVTKWVCGMLAMFPMKSQGTVFSGRFLLLIKKIKGK